MCGRGACTMSAGRCRRVAGHGVRTQVRAVTRLRSRYNISPQGYVPVVRNAKSIESVNRDKISDGCRDGAKLNREVCIMRWGLVPSFAKRLDDFDAFKGGSSTFNARIEGVSSSGLWRRLLDSKRCVMLLDGFYEWKLVGKGKVPMFIRNNDNYDGHVIPASPQDAKRADSVESEENAAKDTNDGPCHAPLLLAALYDVWRADGSTPGSEEDLESASILTMEPDGTAMMDVHDRMPVFLTPQTAALWLDPAEKYGDIIKTVLNASQAHARNDLLLYEVSSLVSNIRNESPDCILPKKDYDARQLSKGIGRFFQKKATTGSDVTAIAGNGKENNEKDQGVSDRVCGKRKENPQSEDVKQNFKQCKVIELD